MGQKVIDKDLIILDFFPSWVKDKKGNKVFFGIDIFGNSFVVLNKVKYLLGGNVQNNLRVSHDNEIIR